MLDTFKRYSKTWVAKVLMGFLILSFGLFGIANVFTNLGSTNVARVGNQSISSIDFDRAYRGQLNSFAQQYGRVPTPEQAVAFGIPGNALSQLASTATVDELVESFGVGASDDMVAKIVAEDPNFAGALGQFDRDRFSQILLQSGYTESEFVKTLAGRAKRNQIITGLFGGITAPNAILEISNSFQNDTRSIDYFTLTDASIGEITAPTDEELTAYMVENQQFYRTEEVRNIDILVLTPETLGKTLTVTDADIEADYAKYGASYITPETRNIKIVSLNDPSQASLLTGLAVGDSAFNGLLDSMGLSDKVEDLGQVGLADIADNTVGEAAFGLSEAGLAVVVAETGTKAILVSNIIAGGQQPLEAVRDQVAKAAAERQAKTIIVDKIDEIEELRATLSPIKDIAAQFGLQVDTVDVTPSGGGLLSIDGLPNGAPSRLLPAIAAAELDKLLPAVVLNADSMAWFDLNQITDARDQTLDEVRPLLLASWTQEQKSEALAKKSEELVAAIDAGEELQAVATANGLEAQTALNITREGNDVVSAQVAAQAFQGGEGHVASATDGDGGYVIFKVTWLNAAPLQEVDPQMQESIAAGLADNVYQQFISAKRDDLGFNVNEAAINQLLSLNATGQ
jgi:peptidyl-prolyl cis-trans isomerase D